MRVISGKYKGLNLKGFDLDGTRPTMDRVKESLFAMIQTDIKNSVCLDLFAGSGSLGIEALSNGAKECYFIENQAKTFKVLKENLTKIKENAICEQQDAFKALKQFQNKIQFDLIFLDPPYSKNLIGPVLEKIEEYHLLKENGKIICEYEQEQFTSNFKLLKEKKYGTKKISILSTK